MNASLEKLRKEYTRKEIGISSLPSKPGEFFREWIQEAIHAKIPEPNAMILSTVSSDNRPSSRTVLLKGIDEEGLIFFTNYLSRKGKEIAENPRAAILFLWLELERQVRIEGKIEKLSEKESDKYFALRPRASQLGAWASPQSQVVDSRDILDKNFRSVEEKFDGKIVNRPPFWGGYRLQSDYFEFWQGRRNRMHDRIVYKYEKSNTWLIRLLAP